MTGGFEFGVVPVGGVIGWLKTFGQVVTGNNTSTSASKLVDSGATFQTSGVKPLMIVRNTSDTTWSYVIHQTASVDPISETQLDLNADIFTASPKTYHVFSTPYLPTGFVECNGQTLSDSSSLFNGKVIPNLNASGGGGAIKRFLRGSTTSGTTADNETHTHDMANHTHTGPSHTHLVDSESICEGTGPGFVSVGKDAATGSAGNGNTSVPSTNTTGSTTSIPSYYEVVMVMRVR